jgi:IclR family acetate operon transcriptional repressor
VKTPVERCLEVLALLCESPKPLSAFDLSVQLQTPKSTVHRFLLTLSTAGWVEQDQATGLYQPSLKMMVIGQRLLLQSRIPDIFQPLLEKLAAATRLLVRMAIVNANSLTWIAQAQGAQEGLVYQPKKTAKISLHTTASGKAWLATLDREMALRLALESGLGEGSVGGPDAIRTVGELTVELDRTAQRGWATALEEAEADIGAVACAISQEKKAIGTVSVAGPVSRFSEKHLPEIADAIVKTAHDLSSVWPHDLHAGRSMAGNENAENRTR